MGLKNFSKITGSSLIIIFFFLWLIISSNACNKEKKKASIINPIDTLSIVWNPPDINNIPNTPEGKMIEYGKELIMHTGLYFGPKGKISAKDNGMNCQNCHLFAGTKFFGNNFSLAASSYPRLLQRSARIETLTERVNGCMERSLNGSAIDTSGKEMRAIIAYLEWVGKGVPKNKKILGSGFEKLQYMERAADPQKGVIVYNAKCARCHGSDGQGVLKNNAAEYYFPPLWGPKSYNTGAGIYRISLLAGFIKNNMPFGATHDYPFTTNEEAWDVAAFINSMPHPKFEKLSKDWPDIYRKPVDYPFGPYADSFPEIQHKYGPFTKIHPMK